MQANLAWLHLVQSPASILMTSTCLSSVLLMLTWISAGSLSATGVEV